VRDKVWWRGVEKNKLIYERCRPVMVEYEGCAVCMKVCPVQRYGMKPVMEHYVETGEVLGKGTENLEGFTLREKGHFGPGKLPHFDRGFFEFPHGRKDDWLFEQFKQKLASNGVPGEPELVAFATDVKKALDEGDSTRDE
jgi:ferredoxin